MFGRHPAQNPGIKLHCALHIIFNGANVRSACPVDSYSHGSVSGVPRKGFHSVRGRRTRDQLRQHIGAKPGLVTEVRMQLVYYKSSVPNFGDDLNPEIWPSLRPELFEIKDNRAFVGIGTIIGRDFDKSLSLNIFASGIGNNPADSWKERDTNYICVRGPLSAKLLGLPDTTALTDGAVVLPQVAGYPKSATSGGRPLVVPHWESFHAPGWEEVAQITGYDLLDPRCDPLTAATRISSASAVLTESLHGAVLADLYDIPWSVFIPSKNFGVAKWVDWSLSLERQFDATPIPPPHVKLLEKYGRRPEPYGKAITFTPEDAINDPRLGADGPARPKSLVGRAKDLFKSAGGLGLVYDCSPARTAEYLIEMNAKLQTPSPRRLIERRQAEMLDRLFAIKP